MASIVATALPQLALATVALHEVLEHGGETGGSVPVASMMPLLHGHAHSADTPDHDHPLTAPFSERVASHARGPLQLASPVGYGGASTSCVLADVWATDGQSPNQRPTQAMPSVLRI